jgi:hypothetical protein
MNAYDFFSTFVVINDCGYLPFSLRYVPLGGLIDESINAYEIALYDSNSGLRVNSSRETSGNINEARRIFGTHINNPFDR